MKLLLVEDEFALAESVLAYLKAEGYVCEWARNFHEGNLKSGLYQYDCALIDITLPDGTGWKLIESIKKESPNTGIIVISAKDAVEDKIKGLDLGADDYLAKPFHLAELNSRIKSIERRRKFEGSIDIQFGEIKVLPDQQEVLVHTEPVILTRKEYDLLMFFISNKNRVLTKQVIAEHIWGDHAELMDSFDFIYSHIKNLRKKLEEKGCTDYIQTCYGIGYKFQLS
jgi:DNA-binding response OmpR family regulator